MELIWLCHSRPGSPHGYANDHFHTANSLLKAHTHSPPSPCDLDSLLPVSSFVIRLARIDLTHFIVDFSTLSQPTHAFLHHPRHPYPLYRITYSLCCPRHPYPHLSRMAVICLSGISFFASLHPFAKGCIFLFTWNIGFGAEKREGWPSGETRESECY